MATVSGTFTASGSTTAAGIKVTYGGNQIKEFALDNGGGIDQRVGDDPIKRAIAEALSGLSFSSGAASGTWSVTAS